MHVILLVVLIFLLIVIGSIVISINSIIKEEVPKTEEELGEELCDYCPLEDHQKGTHLYPSGHYSCEGCRCEEAYEYYLDEFFENQ